MKARGFPTALAPLLFGQGAEGQAGMPQGMGGIPGMMPGMSASARSHAAATASMIQNYAKINMMQKLGEKFKDNPLVMMNLQHNPHLTQKCFKIKK